MSASVVDVGGGGCADGDEGPVMLAGEAVSFLNGVVSGAPGMEEVECRGLEDGGGGPLVFACVAGSVAYGVNKDLSDKDYFGVYVAPVGSVLALDSKVEDTITASEDGGDDFCVHEAAKFGRLLLKGNPGIVEALFNDGDVYTTDAWEYLRERRNAFLSQKVCHHYLGYIRAQIKHYKRAKNPKIKPLYHVVRLLFELERIIGGSCPTVQMEGAERERLMGIRASQEKAEDIIEEAEARMAAIVAAEPWGLPERGSNEVLNTWLLKVRRGEFDFSVRRPCLVS